MIGLRSALLGLAAAACVCTAVSGQVERGEPAPAIEATDLYGAPFESEAQLGRVLVITFGELYHERTLEACGIIKETLRSPKLEGVEVRSVLVVAQGAARRALLAEATDERLPATVLHDPGREAFGAYHVAVMPTVVVIDSEGNVAHHVSGLTGRLGDALGDALLFAAGRLSAEQFDASLAGQKHEAESEELVRAARRTGLARQLMRRGLFDLAGEEFVQALEAAPDYLPARLGMGSLMLRQGRLADAEPHFRAVLEADPHSVEAALGLAQVQVLRGGTEVNAAEELMSGLVARNPDEPRAHYLLGTIHEMRGEHEEAAAAFRTAAELLMSRHENWDVVPGEPGDE